MKFLPFIIGTSTTPLDCMRSALHKHTFGRAKG